MIFASEISKLVDLFGFASWIIHGLAIGCVIILRFTKPDVPRPFKVRSSRDHDKEVFIFSIN